MARVIRKQKEHQNNKDEIKDEKKSTNGAQNQNETTKEGLNITENESQIEIINLYRVKAKGEVKGVALLNNILAYYTASEAVAIEVNEIKEEKDDEQELLEMEVLLFFLNYVLCFQKCFFSYILVSFHSPERFSFSCSCILIYLKKNLHFFHCHLQDLLILSSFLQTNTQPVTRFADHMCAVRVNDVSEFAEGGSIRTKMDLAESIITCDGYLFALFHL